MPSTPSTLSGTPAQHVRLLQGTLEYREYGQGPALVLIHGLLVNGALWRKLVPILAAHYRCIVVELPLGSHAVPMPPEARLSPPDLARLISAFLAALELRNVVLVANDTGGALVQILLTTQPERVAGVVLTNCDAFENFLPPRFRYLNWGARVPGFFWLMGRLLQVPALRRLPFAYGRLTRFPLSDAALARYVAPVRQAAGVRRDLVKVLRGISSQYTLAAAALPMSGRPALIVWGPEDPIFPVAHGRRLAGLLGAELIEVPDTHALVPEDQPLRLAAAIQHFVETRVGGMDHLPGGGAPASVVSSDGL